MNLSIKGSSARKFHDFVNIPCCTASGSHNLQEKEIKSTKSKEKDCSPPFPRLAELERPQSMQGEVLEGGAQSERELGVEGVSIGVVKQRHRTHCLRGKCHRRDEARHTTPDVGGKC